MRKTTTVIAKLPANAGDDLLEELAEFAKEGAIKGFDEVMNEAGGTDLAKAKKIGAEHGAEFDGTGSNGIEVDAFFYIEPDKADVLVTALTEAGIKAIRGRTELDG